MFFARRGWGGTCTCVRMCNDVDKKKTHILTDCRLSAVPFSENWLKLTFALLDSIHAKADWVRCPLLPLCCRHTAASPFSSFPSVYPSPPVSLSTKFGSPLHPATRQTAIALETLTACMLDCVCPILHYSVPRPYVPDIRASVKTIRNSQIHHIRDNKPTRRWSYFSFILHSGRIQLYVINELVETLNFHRDIRRQMFTHGAKFEERMQIYVSTSPCRYYCFLARAMNVFTFKLFLCFSLVWMNNK